MNVSHEPDLENNNPLLQTGPLPAFAQIRPEHVLPAITYALEEARRTVTALTSESQEVHEDFGWDNLLLPLEEQEDRIEQIWAQVSYLYSVTDTPELRAAYNACLPMLKEYEAELGQNEGLFSACQRIADGAQMATLAPTKRKILKNALRDFRLSGVGLAAEKKDRFRQVSTRLSTLESQFAENVLDATEAWKKYFAEPDGLAGLPETDLAMARESAEREGKEGWLLTLKGPSYLAVMTFADDRELRREMYEAYGTRASDQGPHAGRWDNGPVIEEILALRHEKALLLGFENYLDYSLARKMATNGDEVLGFLRDLARRARPVAERELKELGRFAAANGGPVKLESWDIAYYAEKLRQHLFSFSQEELRPYFPLPRVLSGLFKLVEQLFDRHIRPAENRETWHPDVGFYEILDGEGQLQGCFFLDLYARPHKRGGAWMADCRNRKDLGGISGNEAQIQLPVAHLTCNFSPPLEGNPSLLTHEDVLTLFHEFGHGLHHLLTKVDYPSVAGINGVAWDAVELPSQLLELWCWEHKALAKLSGHVETGEPLPDALIDNLRAARNFHMGLVTVRQLEFGLFDLRIHREYNRTRGASIQDFQEEVRQEVAVIRPPAFHRFAHSFSHIFAGGYAAGYYSYKWAEVLASDAFGKFEENGIFDRGTGELFRQSVLEQGGARDAMDLFVAFRGRKPTVDALLRHSGFQGLSGKRNRPPEEVNANDFARESVNFRCQQEKGIDHGAGA